MVVTAVNKRVTLAGFLRGSARRVPGAGVALLLVVCVALSACTSQRPSDSVTVSIPGPTVTETASRAVKVGDDGSVAFDQPGVGSIVGGPGSVTGGGSLSVASVTGGASATASGSAPFLSGVGSGFDVRPVDGAQIAKPLTVTFVAAAPAPDLTPVVAHRSDDGTWEYLPVDWDGKTATLRTQRFSPNVLSWAGAGAVWAWAKPKLMSLLAGRTPAPPCAGNAHGWASMITTVDLVHECLTKSDDAAGERAQLTLTSNRAAWIHVRVPDGADYAWVEGQPDTVRQISADLFGLDATHDVLLPPGAWMTIGFRRSSQPQNRVVYTDVNAASEALSVLTTLPDVFVGSKAVNGSYSSLFTILKYCKLDQMSDPNQLPKAMLCIGGGAVQNLANPKTALAAARDILGPKVDQATLSEQADLLTKFGSRLVDVGFFAKAVTLLVPAIRGALLASYGNLSDAIQQLVVGTAATDITISTTAVPAPVKATPTRQAQAPAGTVPSVAPGAGQGSGGTSVPPPGPSPASTPAPVTPRGPNAPASRPAPTPVMVYDFYGQAGVTGHAMCRGYRDNARSMPGGNLTQTFTVPAGVGSLTSAKVQIDTGDVTAHLLVLVNGSVAARSDAGASGDTIFSFPAVSVSPGAQVTLSITFTATYGTIVTVYTVDAGQGGFTASNSCPAGAPSGTAGSQVLRAQVTGMSS